MYIHIHINNKLYLENTDTILCKTIMLHSYQWQDENTPSGLLDLIQVIISKNN